MKPTVQHHNAWRVTLYPEAVIFFLLIFWGTCLFLYQKCPLLDWRQSFFVFKQTTTFGYSLSVDVTIKGPRSWAKNSLVVIATKVLKRTSSIVRCIFVILYEIANWWLFIKYIWCKIRLKLVAVWLRSHYIMCIDLQVNGTVATRPWCGFFCQHVFGGAH